MKNIVLFLTIHFSFSSAFGQNNFKQGIYDARVNDWEILTLPAAEAPRINGPRVYGVKSGKHYIQDSLRRDHTPSISGFGLPSGLTLDETNGIITGINPEDTGTYCIVFNASNASGNASMDFLLIVGNKITLTLTS
jgi:alpha-galactosidase